MKPYIYVVLDQNNEITSSPGHVSLEEALESMDAIGASSVVKITKSDLEFITRIFNTQDND